MAAGSSTAPSGASATSVGHKTESIYRRYAIVDEKMLAEAAATLDAWTAEQHAKTQAEQRGQVRRFRTRNAG